MTMWLPAGKPINNYPMKKLLWALLAILVIIQFFRPARNASPGISANDISKHYPVPAEVNMVLEKSCNDCHSNHTSYPWYSQIQPVYWWLNDHIQEGKSHLNFSEFGTYRPSRQYHKLEEVIEEIRDGENAA